MTQRCAIIRGPCPQTNDPTARRYCPCWWESTFVNESTGETKTTRSCAWSQLPEYISYLAKESRGAAVSAQHAREAVTNAQTTLLFAITGPEDAPRRLPQRDLVDVSAHSGSVEQPRLRVNWSTPGDRTNYRPSVLRHDAKQADLVERHDGDVEGRNGS